MSVEVDGRGRQFDKARAGGEPGDGVQPRGALVPPVAEELGVKRGGDVRRAVHRRRRRRTSGGRTAQEVGGVVAGALRGAIGFVGALVLRRARDAVILDAGRSAGPGRCGKGAEIARVQFIADVPMILPVPWIAGISLPRVPDAPGEIGIAGKCGDSVGAGDRGEGSVVRPRVGEEKSVRFDAEPPDALAREVLLESRPVGQFRRPEALRGPPKDAAVRCDADPDLCPRGGRYGGEKGQVAMRSCGGDEIEYASFAKGAKRREQSSASQFKVFGEVREVVAVAVGEPVEARVFARPFRFAVCEIHESRQMRGATVHQEHVGEHLGQRGRDGEREAGADAIADKPLEDPEQGKIALDHSFKQPAFLEASLGARPTDVRQVGMKDQAEGGGGHQEAIRETVGLAGGEVSDGRMRSAMGQPSPLSSWTPAPDNAGGWHSTDGMAAGG